MSAYRKAGIVAVAAVVILTAINLATAPSGLSTSSGRNLSPYTDPLGSNTTFTMSGPGANATYYAWVNGPNTNVSEGIAFAATLYVYKAGQNVTSPFTGSALGIAHASFTFGNGSPDTHYSLSTMRLANGTEVMSVSFNGVSLPLANTTHATIQATFTEQSMIGGIHIPGQQRTVSLNMRFNTTQ